MQGDRDVVSDRAVGSVFVIVSTPILQFFLRVRKAMNQHAFRHSDRRLLLNVRRIKKTVWGLFSRRKMKPLSGGFPGHEKSKVTFLA